MFPTFKTVQLFKSGVWSRAGENVSAAATGGRKVKREDVEARSCSFVP